MIRRGPRRLLLLAWLGLAVALAAARGHPIHTSVADADYNRATGKLEVALRVFADDLESALAQHAGRKVSLEKTPAAELDALLRGYVAARFTVRSGDGLVLKVDWVGRQLDEKSNELWCFFEVPLPAGPAGVRLHHGVLTDAFPSQLNSVQLRDGSRRMTLVFHRDSGEKTIRFD